MSQENKKIIAFSVWGDNPKYCVGAVRNAQLREKFYPDWITRFYIHKDVPQNYLDELKNIDGTELVIMDSTPDWTALFWRFTAISDKDVSIMISRDTDSRFSQREVDAVKAFEKSDKKFHIMRDHPHHGFFVLGGMFGIKKGILDDMDEICKAFSKTNNYGTDYLFFQGLKDRFDDSNTLVHDPFFAKTRFPTKRVGLEFVGQVFDEEEKTVLAHLEALKKSGIDIWDE